MDATSDENVFWRVRPKSSSEQSGYTMRVFWRSDSQNVSFYHPIKMDELDEFYFFESPFMKLLLLNGGKTEHVTQLFSSRDDDKGEFQ